MHEGFPRTELRRRAEPDSKTHLGRWHHSSTPALAHTR